MVCLFLNIIFLVLLAAFICFVLVLLQFCMERSLLDRGCCFSASLKPLWYTLLCSRGHLGARGELHLLSWQAPEAAPWGGSRPALVPSPPNPVVSVYFALSKAKPLPVFSPCLALQCFEVN